ncbi:hypothetical protein PybrP1_006165 [[Pythium] brassicae (nom. inval.)]|nr:hypothetical protein PybrP1_006165 [[Pythium] brassicae (nom. inval.)]
MMHFQAPAPGYNRDEEAPMVVLTPASEGVDANGIVVGKWKMGLFRLFNACMSLVALLALSNPAAARTSSKTGAQSQQPRRLSFRSGGRRNSLVKVYGGSGSVFCADSSLRFIYESHSSAHPSAAALSSLSASSQQQHAATVPAHLSSKPQQTHFFMDQLKGSYYDAGKSATAAGAAAPAFPGKRPREGSVDGARGADGVDLYEAEIARACTAITKKVPSLPHSYRECAVCLSENAYAQIALCGHTFHAPCFLRWFRSNRSCPLCRGHVDKVAMAPVVTVQDDIEALMAGMDEEDPLDLDAKGLVDPLLESPDLMSFLASDFDTDMNMAALDDMAPVDLLGQDMDMDMDAPEPAASPAPASTPTPTTTSVVVLTPKTESVQAPSAFVAPPACAPPPMQFAPSSTLPNYWNVLSQGLSCIPPAPLPHTTSHSSQQRMVHIAPRPDATTLQRQRLAPATIAATTAPSFQSQRVAVAPLATAAVAAAAAAPRVVSCRCTGGCRNGRCACVKEGGMCGVSCRCTSCKNPFLMVKAAGADIDALLQDSCFMHNVSKTRDMVQRLQEAVRVPCCGRTVTVLACVQGFACAPCQRRFDFSWCSNKLLDREKTPRNHCDICKRCCDHRDVHCSDCGRCYFAGVATSLPCPCKEATHHKKRRELAESDSAHAGSSSGAGTGAAARSALSPQEEEEGDDGECCIM